MKKILLIILLCCSLSYGFSQDRDQISLLYVSVDSLKNYVESISDYRLFFTQTDENERVSVSFSPDKNKIISDLRRDLLKYNYIVTEKDGYLYILKNIGITLDISKDFYSQQNDKKDDNEKLISALSSVEENIASSENKVYIIGNPTSKFAGKMAILSGYVKSVNSGEPVIDAGVMIESHSLSALTDESGYYRINVPVGSSTLTLKAYGMKDTHLSIEVYESGNLDIKMSEIVYSLTGSVVYAESSSNVRNTNMGIEKIRIDKIKNIPTVFGEADILKVVLTLPGVKSVGESSGGFNVRGGATDQNLILFNGGTIYNPTHLFGLFSAFNPDIISDIELYKSSIPAKFGGRISSVLEVNSRSGNANKISGSAGIGLLSGKFHLEGPIFSEKTTFITGVRSSYSNWILGFLPESSGYNNGAANFYDATLGVNHRFNERNSLQVFGYYSNDGFKFSADTSYKYNSMNASLKWKNIVSDKMNYTMTAGVDRYNHYIEEAGNQVNAYRMSFRIDQYYAKIDFSNMLSDKHTINYGLNLLMYDTKPGILTPIGEYSLVIPKEVAGERGAEAALFIGDTWKMSPSFSVDFGIRYSVYSMIGPTKYYKYFGEIIDETTVEEEVAVKKGELVKPYHAPEFRFSMKYDVNSRLILKAGFNTMKQYIHMISNTVAVSPTDTWKLSDYNIKPQDGWQAAAGIFKIFEANGNDVELSLEGYYKRLYNYLDYKSGAQINMNENIERDIVTVTGKAYGAELMLKKELGKLNGWIGYTYSRTLLKEQGEKEFYNINRGEWYSAPYDKPHDFKIVANYKFTHRFSVSLNLDYSTGRPITVPVRVYKYLNGYRLQYSDRNAHRIPDYFRLDVAINIEPSHYLRKMTHSTVTLGVYNLTGRQNAFSVFFETKANTINGYKLSIFGAPIPYISYNIKF